MNSALGKPMASSIVIAAAASSDLEPAPISPGWILSGTPEAQSKMLASSSDGASCVMVWECTAGRFSWHYSEDETAIVISGEVFITTQEGQERRLGQGDMAFFPAGTSCIWRVDVPVRKVAVIRKTLPLPLALGLRAWNKLLRTMGLKTRPSVQMTLLREAQPHEIEDMQGSDRPEAQHTIR